MQDESKANDNVYELCILSSDENTLNSFENNSTNEMPNNVIPLKNKAICYSLEVYDEMINKMPEYYNNYLYLYNENSDEIINSINEIIEVKREWNEKAAFNIFLLGNNQTLKESEFKEVYEKIKADINNENIKIFNLGQINYNSITKEVVKDVIKKVFTKLNGDGDNNRCCCSII